MAKQVKNEKGFLIIKCSLVELNLAEDGCCMGICDRCNDCDFNGYLIPVLGRTYYCEKCYKDWLSRAEKYKEDEDYEKSVFNHYKKIFQKAGVWEQKD